MSSSDQAPIPGRSFDVPLLARKWISSRTFELRFPRPSDFEFRPGQRARFLADAIERDYSFVSAPGEETLDLCVRLVEDGLFTPRLASAEIDTRFTIAEPLGYFIYHPGPLPAVFVATGTGIAPFVSMARSGITGFTVLHGVPTRSELYYEDELRAAAAEYTPCLSREPVDGISGSVYGGRVTSYLSARLAPGRYDFYVCGNREMIRDVLHLVDERFPESLIHTETFY